MTLAATEPRLTLADWRHAERLLRSRREALVPVREPMVLISQVERSGGHLLNSLLDGHPQLHVHPWEIQVGHPLDLEADADEWLAVLREPWLLRAFERGYPESPLPVGIVPSFVDGLFRVLVADDRPTTRRAVLDHYFTAFFNAWLDCQGLGERPKSWITGFCPRLARGESRARWRADFPDGRLVEIAAARREDADGDFVLSYERLVSDTEGAMRELAGWLGIEWTASLLEPTFNRRPISAS
jgi:hypothetical protein